MIFFRKQHENENSYPFANFQKNSPIGLLIIEMIRSYSQDQIALLLIESFREELTVATVSWRIHLTLFHP